MNTIQKIHERAKKNGMKHLPDDIPYVIIKLLVECALTKKTPEQAASEFVDDMKPGVEAYINTFKRATPQEIYKFLDKTIADKAHLDVEKNFTKNIIKTTKKLYEIVNCYYGNKIDEKDLVEKLCESGLLDCIESVAKMSGVNIKNPNILKMPTSMFAYAGFSMVYLLLMDSLNDASLAFEHRKEVEKESAEIVEQIRTYRIEMDKCVSLYLFEHIETFNSALNGMNQAILDDDLNGFIKGNVTIQEKLKYNVQFTTFEEFDDLMNSDESFKL